MTYVSEVMADVPKGYWHVSGPQAGPFADSSGNGNVLNWGGGSTQTLAAGLVTNQPDGSVVCRISPVSALVAGSAAPAHDLGDVFTLECWIQRASTSDAAYMHLIAKANGGYAMRIDSTNHLVLQKDGAGQICASTTTIADLLVHHCVVTKNGATCAVIIDGVDRSGTVTNLTCANTTYWLTVGSSNGALPFNGTIDEVAIYPTALSLARVQAHYNAAPLPPATGSPSRLLLHLG